MWQNSNAITGIKVGKCHLVAGWASSFALSTRIPLLPMFAGTVLPPWYRDETTVRNSRPWFTTTSSKSIHPPFLYLILALPVQSELTL
jgi:hypothetical protein